MEARPAQRRVTPLEDISLDNGFPGQPVPFTHELHRDPRLTLEAIAHLAEQLPQSVVCDRAAQGLLVPHGGPPKGALEQPGDVIRNLGSNDSWITLLNVEQDPSYAQMMDSALDRVELDVRDRSEQLRQRAAFILASSPNSVTPVHFDIEHSLLVQVSGSKTVTVGRFANEAARRHEVERYFDGSHGRMEAIPEEMVRVDLEPGTGVYIPPVVPHWVHNDPAVSISITLTYFTVASKRSYRIEELNSHLRRFRLTPRPPGKSAVVDAAKTAVIGAWRSGVQLRTNLSKSRARS